MPISATGSRRSRNERGFTLVELLVVLAIIGLMSAVVVFAMPDPRGKLAAEAETFAARANAARDRSIIDARAVRLEVDAGGYRFARLTRGRWAALAEKPLMPARWEEGVRANTVSVDFDPTGIAFPQSQVVLERGEERISIAIGSDGGVHVGR